MYSKQQASQIKQEFWTAFGRYMQPVLSADGEEINWINYKTGVKHISFKMQAGKGASVAVEITHPQPEERQACFEKFQQHATIFHNAVGEGWVWQPGIKDENGKAISRIYTEITGVNVMNRADWPQLISFLKPSIIALDAFWSMVKPAFEP